MSSREAKGSSQEAGGELGPLPGGHHGLTPEQVADSQRERLLAGLVEAIAANGYATTTIADIVGAASVSTRAFYEHFDSKESCFLAAFDAVVDHLRRLIEAAVRSFEDWPQQVVAALRTAVDFFAAQPDLARLCLAAPVTANATVAARFREVVVSCAPYLALGRGERSEARALPPSTEDSLTGGLIALGSRSILAESRPPQELLAELVEFVLAPYLGPEQAHRLAVAAAASGP